MSGQFNANNVKIAPHDAFYEASEAICVNFRGVSAADLDGKFLRVFGSDGTEYNPWFDVDDSSVAPAGATGTLVEVDLASGDIGAAIATKFATAVIGSYTLSADGTSVFLVNGDVEAVANNAEDGDTGVANIIDVLTKGGNIKLGLMDGDVTITPTSSVFTVTAHQTGTTELNRIYQGFSATVELTLLECTKSLYDEMISLAGGSVFTPSGGTQVAGAGTGLIGASALLTARTLRLHPVSKDASDLSSDWYFWKASPEIGGITISGENPQTLPLTFTAYPDTTKQEIIDIWMLGDGSQAGLLK